MSAQKEPAPAERYRTAAAPRQVSPPVPVRTAGVVAATKRERPLSPLSGALLRSSIPDGPAQKKAKKSYEDITMEVPDLLETKLLGAANDDGVRVEALQTLRAYFKTIDASPQERQEKEEYQRVVTEWNGCHLVLVALRHELDKAGGGGTTAPNPGVVRHALLFLWRWNDGSAGCRDVMSRLRGVETVARAMRDFRNDANVQHAAVNCLSSFAWGDSDGDRKRRRKLVAVGSIQHIFRAIMAPRGLILTRNCGARLLGRLCEVAEPCHFAGLVERGALEAVAKIAKAHKATAEHDRNSEKVVEACRLLMAKLI
jgi:hypothetical protein